MLRIADMSKIELRVDVGENDIPKVKLGDSALIEVDAYSDRKFKGIVTQIASSNNGAASINALANTSNDVTQYKVYIRLIPSSYIDLLGKGSFPFRPGMSANADIQTKTHANVLSVPINAVTTREVNDSTKTDTRKKDESDIKPAVSLVDDLEVVAFVIDKEGTVSKVKVKTDIQDINNIEITSGLKEGDQVVTGPYDVVSKTLKAGKKVKVVDKKDLFEKN
jgi:HlyD family secretion protein